MIQELKTIKLRNLVMLTLAGAVNAFGVTVFLAPVNLYDSGISGTSMLLARLTPEAWTLSVFLLILNVPLFLFGYKKQGARFTFYAIYSVVMYSLFAYLITDVSPLDVALSSPFAGTDLLLCAIFGGVISGLGSGLTVRFGGAIDGLDILGIIFSKRLGLSLGTFVMIYNVLLYILCGIIMQSWILPLYSIVAYAAASKTIDFCVEGFDRSKAAFIITSRPQEVCAALSDTFRDGITMLPAKGYYSGKDKTMVYFVVNRFQIARMKSTVHEHDPLAYISICEVADIFPAVVSEE